MIYVNENREQLVIFLAKIVIPFMIMDEQLQR